MNEIIKVLVERDGLTKTEAKKEFKEAQEELNRRLVAGEDCYDICEEYFGLEPDYLMDLIPTPTISSRRRLA